MAVPAAPTALAVTPKVGLFEAAWTAPAGPVTGYYLDYSPTNTFVSTGTRDGTFTSKTVAVSDNDLLTPGSTYYARVRAYNSDGVGANSSTVGPFLIPSRTALDAIRGASVNVDGNQVEIRSNGTNANPTLTLGVIPMGLAAGDTTFTTIEVLPRVGVGGFESGFGPRGFSIVVDPTDGDLYVIGMSSAGDGLTCRKYNRTGAATWSAVGQLGVALPKMGTEIISQVAASFSASTTRPSIVVVYRRTGSVTASGSFGAAILNPVAFDTADPFVFDSANDPSWMSTPGSAVSNSVGVDIERLQRNGNTSTFAVTSNGYATITVTAGVITSVAKATAGTVLGGLYKRVLSVDPTSWVLVYDSGLGVAMGQYDRNCVPLKGRPILNANFQGANSVDKWGAWFDIRLRAVNVDYITETANQREVERYRWYIDPDTNDITVLTAAMGGAAGINETIRVPNGWRADERRVVVEGALLNGGAKSTSLYADRSSNVAPSTPVIPDKVLFDATAAQTFTWGFSDPNTADTQRAFELEIQNTSTLVNTVDVAKTVSTAQTYTVTGGTLTNGVTYRYRVMVYDASDAASAWSAYDTFVCAAEGTLTITTPNADDLAGFMTSSVALNWTYTQPNGYVQTKRRIRVIRDSDGVVLSDTTMQASVVTGETVTGVPTDERVRIELSIENNAPAPVTVTRLRYLTTSYSLPMANDVDDVEDSIGDGGYLQVRGDNPIAAGDRPDTAYLIVQRRYAGQTDDEWVSIGTTPGINGSPSSYNDYTVIPGTAYEYRFVAVGGGAQNPGDWVGATAGLMMGVYLHDITDPEGSARNFIYTTVGRRETVGRVSTSNVLVGRKHPVIDYGDAETETVTVTFEVPFSDDYDAEVLWWRTLALSGATLFYRDNRGRGFYTTLANGVVFTESRSAMLIGVTFPAIDYEIEI